ncbi:hypothetical protein PENTCL1PPCAC_15635 [Pristionchus entomophagus]|uniref:Glutathione-dependent dehydroascorbate reductase n=1 Tax=Pristionchus entomophagus TaxID=358040 RepID=A0AAV5TDY1_9BILA|nr:hypothetical protein PENTCL1PPCAC_15635 [Pristionchus entomophagus]
MVKVIGNNTPALKTGDPEPKLAKGKARIYSNRFCPYSERALLYAAAKGFEVEIVNINLKEKPEWYFSKHPQGKVPAFERDGEIVIESSIIPDYLDDIYPSSAILPTDPYEKAKQRIMLEQAAPVTTTFFGLYAVNKDKLEGEARFAKLKAVEDALDGAEKLLKDKYFGGSTAGYADWLLFPFFERIAIFSALLDFSSPFPGDRWPALSAWWARISVHPAVAAVTQPPALHHEFIEGFLSGKPVNDIGI